MRRPKLIRPGLALVATGRTAATPDSAKPPKGGTNTMADHLDAPGLMSPNMDARIDVTDIYAFQAPDDPNRAVLILNVNPLAPTLATAFSPAAIYELKIDTNGDAVADIAYRVRFSDPALGPQKAMVHRATGAAAAGANTGGPIIINGAGVDLAKTSTPTITESGGYKFYASIRSDPFFFDLAAFLGLAPHAHPLDFTNLGSDFFIDKNVFSIVLSAPKSQLLGPNASIGY